MPGREQARHHQLVQALRGEYGHLRISGLHEIGRGMDARVYRADSPELGPVAIRMPHDRWVTSGNEPQLDTRRQLRQDYRLSRHLRDCGVPVPEVFILHADDAGTDFTIAQYIEADGSELPASELGRLIRAVHDIPVPGLDLVCMDPSGDLDEVLSARIGQRLENLTAGAVPGLDLPDLRAALAAGPAPARRCLLHMDLRPDNILARSSRPAAILDWGNALAGDPALDLARTAEYGALTPDALAAYGDPGTFTMTPQTPRQVIYRLDTAVMLSHVFLGGAPDPARARHYIDRTRNLCRALQ
jgi:aminoglycoside phosphotransferase (APT) family kinase protein